MFEMPYLSCNLQPFSPAVEFLMNLYRKLDSPLPFYTVFNAIFFPTDFVVCLFVFCKIAGVYTYCIRGGGGGYSHRDIQGCAALMGNSQKIPKHGSYF